MNCIYVNTKTGKSYSSEFELLNDFLKENFQLKGGSIYSSEEVQSSTLNKLKKINSSKYDRATDGEYLEILELVSEEQPAILRQHVELKHLNRLSPEYDVNNRIKNYVAKRINDIDSQQIIDFDRFEKEHNDKTGTQLVDVNRFNTLRSLDIFKNNSDSEIKLLQRQIEEEINVETVSALFSTHLYKMIDLALQGKSFKGYFENLYTSNNTEAKMFLGDTYTQEEWYNQLSRVIFNISNKIKSIGIPLTNIKLIADSPTVKVKGIVNITATDLNGDSHIFIIKASKNSFSEWDSGKLSNVDWELAIQRQLLGQNINVSNSKLYIIPIKITSNQNPNGIYDEDFENRTINKLSNTSSISLYAEKLVPRKFFPKHDGETVNKINELFNSLIPNYELRTESDLETFDEVLEKAKRRFDKEGVWRINNKYDGAYGLKSGWNEASSQEELEKLISLYISHQETLQNRTVSMVRSAIIEAIENNDALKTSKHKSESDIVLNKTIQQYLNKDWEVLNAIPEAISLGIILLRNVKNNTINVLNISGNQFKFTHKETGLLGGDLEGIKVMMFLNEFRDQIFPNTSYKIGEIITYNPKEGSPWTHQVTPTFEKFQRLMRQNNLESDIKLNDDYILGIEDIALVKVMTTLDNYVGKEADNLNKVFNVFGNKHLSEIEKRDLLEVNNLFLQKYPEYKKLTIKPELNFGDPLEVIFSLLQVAILSKEGIDPTGDFRDLSKYSLGMADFKTLLTAFYTKDIEQYDKTGQKIQGIVGGLSWATPEWVQSKDMRQINGLISTGNSIIGERMVKFSEGMWKLTDNFYNNIGYNRLEQLAWGETQSIHSEFFLRDSSGNFHPDFKTKNPYVTDVENALESEHHRKYLMHALLKINAYKFGIADHIIENLNPENLESLKSVDKFAEALDNGKYFEMPLMRREEQSKYKGLFMSAGDNFRRLGAIQDKVVDWIDGRELSQYDLQNVNDQSLGFFEMYDAYGTQEKWQKNKMIEENGFHYYEFNLDTIAHKMAFSKIRKQTFDMILPTVSAYMWWLKLMGGRQNVDITKQMEYIINQVKLAVFDEPLIGDEQKTIAKGIAFAKKISTTAMLAFRPALLAKELTIGFFKNFSGAATGLFEEFGTKEMTQAYTKLITIDKQFSNEFNMIQKLNHMYRMANMDISTVAGKMQHDRHGIARGAGRWMFATSTAADYYNRMAILLAKMIKDGSYEAHSMEDNKLVYNPRKDKRFEYYLSEREKHKDENGNYTNKKGDQKYNQQRSLYLLTVQQLNKEYGIVNRKPLTENDLIDKAYTQKERNSFKAMSDLLYGAYDKDSQAQFPSTLLGIATMQFLTYWPSKMKFWFGKPVSGEDSAIGKFEHAYSKDAEGNAILGEDGKPIYLYFDYEEDSNGKIIQKVVEYETDEKVITWNGTPQEGLFYSVAYTMQDILRGDWDSLKNNKLRRNRTLFALGDGLFIWLMFMMMRAIWQNISEEQDRGSFSGELVNFMQNVNEKVYNEYDLLKNTFFAIQTEPLFLGWGLRAAKSMQNVLTGDLSLQRALTQNIGALEMFK